MKFTFLCDWTDETETQLYGDPFAIVVTANSHAEAAHKAAETAINSHGLQETHNPEEFWNEPNGARIASSHIGDIISTLTNRRNFEIMRAEEPEEEPACPHAELLRNHGKTVLEALAVYEARMASNVAKTQTAAAFGAIPKRDAKEIAQTFREQQEKGIQAREEINAISPE
ncbi:hypothetical protein GCM10009801_73360 [Streptomyces albiaxialis]|uniref:Uncharacterized protein n=1 Tax=Streptomyces albiaxialis TaxID=329523 RepID=A0ABN2WX38_9ACTN